MRTSELKLVLDSCLGLVGEVVRRFFGGFWLRLRRLLAALSVPWLSASAWVRQALHAASCPRRLHALHPAALSLELALCTVQFCVPPCSALPYVSSVSSSWWTLTFRFVRRPPEVGRPHVCPKWTPLWTSYTPSTYLVTLVSWKLVGTTPLDFLVFHKRSFCRNHFGGSQRPEGASQKSSQRPKASKRLSKQFRPAGLCAGHPHGCTWT